MMFVIGFAVGCAVTVAAVAGFLWLANNFSS